MVKVWRQCVQAEERSKMLQTLVREGLGTHDVENYRMKQAKMKFGKGKGERDEGKICEDMRGKLTDNLDWEKKVRGDRGRQRSKLEKLIGQNSNRYKKFVNKVRDKMRQERSELQRKYSEKVKRLKVNIKKESRYKIPPEIDKYSDVGVFKSDIEITPEELKGPVIVGQKGKLVLGDDEKKVLTRGPKFTIRRCLDKERFLIEMEKSLLKEKWDRSQREHEGEELVDMDKEESDRVNKIAEEQVAKSRQVFDGEEMIVNFANHKVTDAKMNTRVVLPRSLTPKEEGDLEVRRTIWASLFDRYKESMTDEEGVQESNLSTEETRGLKSLQERIKSGEIVICQTDKSGRFAVLTREDYERAGMKHVKGDQEVDLEYVRQNNRVLNGHCSMWLRIFLVGANWGHEDRHRETKITNSLSVCPLYLLFKDHKGWEWHMGGVAPTRPVASANSGANVHFSELLSQTIEPLANKFVGGMEWISTCDMLSDVDKLNADDRPCTESQVSPLIEDKMASPLSKEDPVPVQSSVPLSSWRDSDTMSHVRRDGDKEPTGKEDMDSSTRTDCGQGKGVLEESRTENQPKSWSRRGTKMREMRAKMEMMRKPLQFRQGGEEDMILTEKREAKTWRGQKLVGGREVNNSQVQDRDKKMLVVGSDVEALYPSLEDMAVAEICYKAVMESKVKFEGVNYREAVLYVALNWTAQQCRLSKLRRVLPRRAKNSGTRPGMTGEEALDAGGKASKQWVWPKVCLTEEEKRMIVATVIQIGVLVMFSTHVYQFAGRFFLQKKGGPIGLRSTCAVARLTMLEWDRIWLRMLEENGMRLEARGRYMDDLRAFLFATKMGWRWHEGGLWWCKQWEVEDKREGLCDLGRTTKLLEAMMRDVMNFLKMTMETALDFEDRMLPTLDTKLWIREDNKVMYLFFEKKMASNQALQKDTAMPENQKMSSLNGEVVRRMTNTSEMLPLEDRIRVLDTFSQKLANSGYRVPQIRTILVGGLKRYERKLKQSKLEKGKGWSPLHEGAGFSEGKRYKKKLMGKSTWFKEKPEESGREDNNQKSDLSSRRDSNLKSGGGGSGMNRKSTVGGQMRDGVRMEDEMGGKQDKKTGKLEVPTTTVLFVDITVGGELARRIRAEEDKLAAMTGFRVRVVESGGTQIKQLLPCVNPWAGAICGREDCYTCKQGDKTVQDCFRRNILYESTCMTCEDRLAVGGEDKAKKKGGLNGQFVYVGESSRSLYERSQEHLRDGRKRTEDSHIWKHWSEHHPGEDMPRFGFRVAKTFSDCLTRQVAESVRIDMRGGQVLNSKTVYSRCKITRLVVDTSEWKKEDNTEPNGAELLEGDSVEDNMEAERDAKKIRKTLDRHEQRPTKRLRKERNVEVDWGQNLVEGQDRMREWLLEDKREEDSNKQMAGDRTRLLEQMAAKDATSKARLITDCFSKIKVSLGVAKVGGRGQETHPGQNGGLGSGVDEQNWAEIESELGDGEPQRSSTKWEKFMEEKFLKDGRNEEVEEGWKEEMKKQRMEKARRLTLAWRERHEKSDRRRKENPVNKMKWKKGKIILWKENDWEVTSGTSGGKSRKRKRKKKSKWSEEVKRLMGQSVPRVKLKARRRKQGWSLPAGWKTEDRNSTGNENWKKRKAGDVNYGWRLEEKPRKTARTDMPVDWIGKLVDGLVKKAVTEGWKAGVAKMKREADEEKRIKRREGWKEVKRIMNWLEEEKLEIPEGWKEKRLERAGIKKEGDEGYLAEWMETRSRHEAVTTGWMGGLVKLCITRACTEGWKLEMKRERVKKADLLKERWKELESRMDWEAGIILEVQDMSRMETDEEVVTVPEGWKSKRMERRERADWRQQDGWQQEEFLMDWAYSVGLESVPKKVSRMEKMDNTLLSMWQRWEARRGSGERRVSPVTGVGNILTLPPGNITGGSLSHGLCVDTDENTTLCSVPTITGAAGNTEWLETRPVEAAIAAQKSNGVSQLGFAVGDRKVAKGRRRKVKNVTGVELGPKGGLKGAIVQRKIIEYMSACPGGNNPKVQECASPLPRGDAGSVAGGVSEYLSVWQSITRKRVRSGNIELESSKKKQQRQ